MSAHASWGHSCHPDCHPQSQARARITHPHADGLECPTGSCLSCFLPLWPPPLGLRDSLSACRAAGTPVLLALQEGCSKPRESHAAGRAVHTRGPPHGAAPVGHGGTQSCPQSGKATAWRICTWRTRAGPQANTDAARRSTAQTPGAGHPTRPPADDGQGGRRAHTVGSSAVKKGVLTRTATCMTFRNTPGDGSQTLTVTCHMPSFTGGPTLQCPWATGNTRSH